MKPNPAAERGERVYFSVGPSRYAVVIIPESEPRPLGVLIPFPSRPAEKVQQKPEDSE
jgi:hypothetical protein